MKKLWRDDRRAFRDCNWWLASWCWPWRKLLELHQQCVDLRDVS
jgi:hypothetical protein